MTGGDEYDVVVVGAGIHGCGVAQAAAAGGYRTLVLERSAVAAGTSSRSSKLIHGGLRYLETAQLGLVHESLRERAHLLRLAPDLVHRVAFYIPVYRETSRRPWELRAGLSLYSLLGRLGADTRFTTLPRREWDRLDGLVTQGLQAVFQYYDAQTDDAALTRAVMASAQALGAELACPARFLAAEREARGYRVRFRTGAAQQECLARTLVNAAGPWVNRVLDAVTPAPPQRPIDLVQGSHIVVPGTLERGVYYVEAPADRRAVFVMPWHGQLLVGTTETVYEGDPAAVTPLPQEIDYLRRTLAHYFPARATEPVAAFAGLRVLPRGRGRAFDRPRETILLTDDRARPRLLTVYGGKLTGYRVTAARVLRRLAASLPPARPRADTTRLPLAPVSDDARGRGRD